MDPTFQLLHGDCRATLVTLPDASVQCCVTSPPYWGLRDYGTPEQIGLESTPDAYVAELVAVFREVRRVLKDDGVCWLNLGSSYFTTNPGSGGKTSKQSINAGSFFYVGRFASQSHRRKRAPACGSDGTTLQGSTDVDFSYSGLCDGCLADFLSHRAGIVGSGPQSARSAPPHLPTARGNEPVDSETAPLGVSLPDVLASTTIESWRQHRDACLRCDSRASDLSRLNAYARGGRPCVDTVACNVGSGENETPSTHRTSGMEHSGLVWLNYTTTLKHKDLVPIPWMVAMALQADGWWLRSDVIWAKPNPMPESVTDRPTKAHEYVFLLAKAERYYYDAEAIAEASVGTNAHDLTGQGYKAPGQSAHTGSRGRMDLVKDTRNARMVWTIATQPYRDAHFAVMPEALATRCILAGSRVGDTILDPFAGAGTTGVAALGNGRSFIGCEANAAYVDMARRRLQGVAPLFAVEQAG